MKKLLHILLFTSLALPLNAMQSQENNTSTQSQHIEEAKRFVKDNALKFLVLLSPFILIAFLAWHQSNLAKQIAEIKSVAEQLEDTNVKVKLAKMITDINSKRKSDNTGDNPQPTGNNINPISSATSTPTTTTPAQSLTSNPGDSKSNKGT